MSRVKGIGWGHNRFMAYHRRPWRCFSRSGARGKRRRHSWREDIRSGMTIIIKKKLHSNLFRGFILLNSYRIRNRENKRKPENTFHLFIFISDADNRCACETSPNVKHIVILLSVNQSPRFLFTSTIK